MPIEINHQTSPSLPPGWWKASRVLSVATGLCLLLGVASPSWAAPEPKVDICHRSQKGKNVIFKVQSVKQSAVPNHLAHGDNLVQAEICDGMDNDCNGIVDDNPTDLGSCFSTGVGECATQGQESCLAGVLSCNAVEGQPTTEVCDGLDNDCDGNVDNGVADIVTGTNEGECQEGTQSCIDGAFQVTQAEIGQSAEVCDGLDNDCNATVDDSPAANIACDDGISCTGDTCVAGACEINPDNGQCSLGEACTTSQGCVIPKVVFTTREGHNGNLGGLAGGDAICQAAADSPASIVPPGTYIAWLWTFTTAPDDPSRLPNVKTDTYVRPDGVVIDFSNWEVGLNEFINVDETGDDTPNSSSTVWTGAPNIGSHVTCSDWTSGSDVERGGRGVEEDLLRPSAATHAERWYTLGSSSFNLCDAEILLYCFQQQ